MSTQPSSSTVLGTSRLPLRCADPLAERNVHAFDLSPEVWQALGVENRRTRHLQMPCCSAQVILRKSKLGTQFFAHKNVASCTTVPESEAHLRLKRTAVEAARRHGWAAETEVSGASPSGERWTADVLASRGRHKVAVEIQWSRQTNEETLRRQERYAQSGVRCLWLFRHGGFPTDQSLPAACVVGDAQQGFSAQLGCAALPIESFLDAAFGRRLCFGLPVGCAALTTIHVGYLFCWACGAETRIIKRIAVDAGTQRFDFSISEIGAHPEFHQSMMGRLPGDLTGC